jgi:vitamin K-dependent gamma-carboxylase
MSRRSRVDALFAPVDIASLVAFRIAFGALMVVAIGRYFAHDWIGQFFVVPRVFFPYPGLAWIVPLPAPAMYGLFAALGVAAVCVTVGFWYRPAILLFCLGFTYVHLIDRTNYLNHYYLISLLSALLVFLPVHRAGSLDVWRKPKWRVSTVSAWIVWLLRFQLAVVYVFGAVAKINPDWLLQAQPLRIWLGANVDLPMIGRWIEPPWVAHACSYAGLLFDAAIVPLLLWRRTRLAAYAAVLAFHVCTALLFPIGLFPWLMIALTPIFFEPDWPRRWVARRRLVVEPAVAPALTLRRRLGMAGLAAYALVQIAVPLRHVLYAGDLHWSEEGFRFAWQIMVMEKYGRAVFTVTDPVSGLSWRVVPGEMLTPLQSRMMATQPDLVLAFAHELARDYSARVGHTVEVRSRVLVTLNGRPSRLLVDPSVDLARLPEGAAARAWLLPRAILDVGITRRAPPRRSTRRPARRTRRRSPKAPSSVRIDVRDRVS